MGAYCDPAILSTEQRATIIRTIVEPTLNGIRETGTPFTGFLYCGLMMTAEGPKVLEYNVRLGDPETQPLMYRMTGDLAELLLSAANGELDTASVHWSDGPTVCVVLASQGYPGNYPKGRPIDGIRAAEEIGAKVFHAGTRFHQGKIATAGGRVLGVTAGGKDLDSAIANTYAAVQEIHFEGAHYRSDIGQKGLRR
jgi:phosphoribosylamine--glycine ligase